MDGEVHQTFGFARYVEDEAHLAYRLIHYNKHSGIIYMIDEVVSNDGETNELTQFRRTTNSFSSTQKLSLSQNNAPVALVESNDKPTLTEYFITCNGTEKDILVTDFGNI